MAYITGNRTAPASSRLADLRVAAGEAYANWRLYRQTLNELNALSGAELADLGINRSMVRRIAIEAAYGPNA